MLLSRKKLKLKLPLALSGCHRPQWKRGKGFSCLFLSSTGMNLFSLVNITLKFNQKAHPNFILLGLIFALLFSHSQRFKKTSIWYYTAAGVNLLIPRIIQDRWLRATSSFQTPPCARKHWLLEPNEFSPACHPNSHPHLTHAWATSLRGSLSSLPSRWQAKHTGLCKLDICTRKLYSIFCSAYKEGLL